MVATYTFDTTGFTQEQVNMIPAALGFLLWNSKGVSYEDIDLVDGSYVVSGATNNPAVSKAEILATVIEQQAALVPSELADQVV